MARTNIPVTTIGAFTYKSADQSLTAGDSTNDHSFTWPGNAPWVLLFIKNAGGSAITATVASVATPHTMGRTGDISCAVTNAKESFIFVPREGFLQSDGTCYVNLDTSSSVSLAVLSPAPPPVG